MADSSQYNFRAGAKDEEIVGESAWSAETDPQSQQTVRAYDARDSRP